MMDLHFPILSLALRELVKSKFQPYCQESKARRRWLHKFSQRHRPALWRRTSVSQKLPKQLEEKLSGFYEMYAKFLKIGKHILTLVGNLDKTRVFLDMVPNKSFENRGSKSVTVRKSGFKKNTWQLFLPKPRVEIFCHQWSSSLVKLTVLLKTLMFLITSVLLTRKRSEHLMMVSYEKYG